MLEERKSKVICLQLGLVELLAGYLSIKIKAVV
jgi:hypothetical protein